MKSSLIIISLVFLFSCSRQKPSVSETTMGPEPEAYSFSGKPLYRKPVATPADSAALVKSDSTIAAIGTKSELSETDFIDIGRTLSSTNRFKMAVENYTLGLKKYPSSFRLLRHRGHRYINLRQLDSAIVDLTKAEELIRPEGDVWEYDAAGKPSATYQHQIWYHIGLYHFLKKDYVVAAADFEKSLAATQAKNDGKNKAGASDWLYNSYQRSGQKNKIDNVLKQFTLDYDIEDKEYPYFRRLLLYKGLIKPEDLIDINKPISEMSLLEMTKLYGLANWYSYNGDKETANIFYKKILDSKEWAGFAYAAAELDVVKN